MSAPPPDLSPDAVRTLRLRAQWLVDAPAPDPAAVVQHLVGVPAQDPAAAPFACRPRSSGLTAAVVAAARTGAPTMIRTWAWRGTLHLVVPADLGWMLPLLGPRCIAADARQRAALGLDEATCARGLAPLQEVLAGQGPVSRPALAAALAGRGLPLTGQALPHLLYLAAYAGLIGLGPEQGTTATYVWLAEWTAVPPRVRKAMIAKVAEFAAFSRKAIGLHKT